MFEFVVENIATEAFQVLHKKFIAIPSFGERTPALIEQMYKRAVMHPEDIPKICDFYKFLSTKLGEGTVLINKQKTGFRNLLIEYIQKQVETAFPLSGHSAALIDPTLTQITSEIFERKITTQKWMLSTIDRLLLSPDTARLYAAVDLLSKVGPSMDQNIAAKHPIDKFFEKLQEYSKIEQIPSELKQRIVELLVLRTSNWKLDSKSQEKKQEKSESNNNVTENPSLTVVQEDHYLIKPIGWIRTCFPEKNGTPRQGILCTHSKGILKLTNVGTNPAHFLGIVVYIIFNVFLRGT